MELLVSFIGIWLLSPIVLGIILIVNGSSISSYKKRIAELYHENQQLKEQLKKMQSGELSETDVSTSDEELTEAVAASPPATEPPAPVQQEQPAQEPPEQKAPPKPASPYNMSYKTGLPQTVIKPAPTPKPTPVPAAVKTAPAPKKSHNVSSINILFIIGALFIITAGLIFATTTWEFLSSGIRAVVILSLSALFFGASSLAERKFNLQKTGMLFYTLGSVFLPITLIAAGYFKVFGEWFSLTGDGRPLLLAITFAALSAVTLKGGCDYASKPFSWCGLVSISAAVSCLILQFTDNTALFSLTASIYSLILLFVCAAISKRKAENQGPVISQLNTFAALNTIILSISSLAAAFSDENGALAFVSCAIFAAGYLKSCFTQKNGFAGAVPFTIFATCGIFAVSTADDFSGFAITLTFAAAVPAVLSFMNFFPEKLKAAITAVSGFFAGICTVLCIAASIFAEPTILSLAAYVILAGEILALHLLHKKEKAGQTMLYIFPAACMMVIILAARLINTIPALNDFLYASLITVLLTGILQAVFVFIRPLKLRTAASDFTLTVSAVIGGITVLTSDFAFLGAKGIILCLAGVIAVSAVVMFPSSGVQEKQKLPFLVTSILWSGTALFPLYAVLDNCFTIDNRFDIFIPAMIIASIFTVISVVTTLFCKKEHIEVFTVSTIRAVIGMYVFAVFCAGEISSPLYLLLAASVLFRSLKKNNLLEFEAGIILSIATVLTASMDIFGVDLNESLLFASGAAALIYIAALFMQESSFVKKASAVSGITLLITNTLCLIYVTTTSQWNTAYFAMTALFMLLIITAAYNSRNTLPLAAPLMFLFPAAVSAVKLYTEDIVLDTDYSVTALVCAVLIMLTLIPSYVLHRNKLYIKNNSPLNLYIDIFAFARIIGFCCYSSNTFGETQRWLTSIILAVCIISFSRKEQPIMFKRWIYTISAIMPVIAWITQPFFWIPDVIYMEFRILPILLYCFAMRFLWKDKLAAIDNLTFVVYIVCFLVLFFDAMSGEYLADGLIIVLSALVLLIVSFIIKKKKWFILGVSVIVIATLFMSRNFWASLAWWVYLLGAGLLLIAIAAANELKKQAAAKNEKSELEQKITRFMSEWTW